MQYDFNIPANGGMDISALGQYVKYKIGLGPIRVRMSSGGYVDLIPGQGFRVTKEFTAINISDKSGNANQGIMLVGDYEFQDDTINGVVTVLDGAKNNTLSKNCFLGFVNSLATAGVNNMCCLINPATSLKNVIVESIDYSTATASVIQMYMLGLNPVGNVRAQNKYAAIAGGVPSNAVIEPNNVATLGVLGSFPMHQGALPAGGSKIIKYAEPLILPPGMGIVIVNTTQAAAVNGNFEFREDPI